VQLRKTVTEWDRERAADAARRTTLHKVKSTS
jgi:hypothetical protein